MFSSSRSRPRPHRWISIVVVAVVVLLALLSYTAASLPLSSSPSLESLPLALPLSLSLTLLSSGSPVVSAHPNHPDELLFQHADSPSATMKCRTWEDPQKVKQLVNQVFAVYTTRDPTTQWSWIQRYYSPNVTFEDPLMLTHGLPNYRVQFLSLIKFFKTVEITWNQDVDDAAHAGYTLRKPGMLGEGTTDIVVRNRQVYRFARESWLTKKVLPEVVDLQVETTLTVQDHCPDEEQEAGTTDQNAADSSASDADLKQVIVRHQDVWPEKGPEKQFYTKHVKPVVGRVTSGWFKLIGW